MAKRTLDLQLLPSPGLKDAPVLDLMCSHFVLTLAAKQVVIAGSPAQLAAAVGIVDRARQELYRLLAEAEPAPEAPTPPEG